jgi:hypothetical protein
LVTVGAKLLLLISACKDTSPTVNGQANQKKAVRCRVSVATLCLRRNGIYLNIKETHMSSELIWKGRFLTNKILQGRLASVA